MNTPELTILLDDIRIKSIMLVLKQPNQVFDDILENRQDYLLFAIAIFAISSFFFVSYTDEEPLSSVSINELGFVWDAIFQIENFIESVLWNLLSIALIFYLGNKLGGSSSNSFKTVFSVLAYAMIPILIGGIGLHVFLMNPILLEGISGIEKETLEFATFFWPLYFVFIPFALWSFVLSIMAIKRIYKFGTAKSFGIFIVSGVIVYFVGWAVTLVMRFL